MSNFFEDANIIHSYTRAEAIADGTLIDVTKEAAEAGFRWPVAMTAAAHRDVVKWDESDQSQAYQDESGRLWDVLWMASNAVRRAAPEDRRINYTVLSIARDGKSTEPVEVTLSLVLSGGDRGEPVMTIMLPNED